MEDKGGAVGVEERRDERTPVEQGVGQEVCHVQEAWGEQILQAVLTC